MKPSPLVSIAPADLAPVTGGGVPSLGSLPIIIVGVAGSSLARAWGNQFSWQRPPAGGYENPR
jgi:hypothetical protein